MMHFPSPYTVSIEAGVIAQSVAPRRFRADETVYPFINPDKHSLHDCARFFCEANGITVVALCGPDRTRTIAHKRQDFMRWVFRTRTRSSTMIGNFLGGRDHTTILHGIKKSRERHERKSQCNS